MPQAPASPDAPVDSDQKAVAPSTTKRPAAAARPGRSWGSEPRNLVFLALILALLVGGGKKLLEGWKARRAITRLEEGDATPEEIEAVAAHGRAALPQLFSLLESAKDPAARSAAGRALARLWASDELVAEEEKAIITRGVEVHWRARKRYPADLQGEIPIEIAFRVPFLQEAGPGIRPDQLEWSWRIKGGRRVSLEQFADWQTIKGPVHIALDASDFSGHGPQTLILQLRVRNKGLSPTWEHELPQTTFRFELDPQLASDSILTLADSDRRARVLSSVQLEVPENVERGDPTGDTTYTSLDPEFALVGVPRLVLSGLPCDLTHRVTLEFQGVNEPFAAGRLIALAPNSGDDRPDLRPLAITPSPKRRFEKPGDVLARAVLKVDAALGWTDPDVRSVWPESVETPWITCRIVRR